ncbi:MAG: hypothetical protein RBR22_08055 [Desulfuromonas sp.]|nr:hypothetical protein [Desulfuromonas sp.]
MPACISVNTTEIIMRNSVRNELKNKTAEFLKSNSITVLETRTAPRPERPAYNSAISVSPAKAKQVSVAREELATLVRELATVQLMGLEIKRSATEIAKVMRCRGYKMRAPSVIRIAESIGIALAA